MNREASRPAGARRSCLNQVSSVHGVSAERQRGPWPRALRLDGFTVPPLACCVWDNRLGEQMTYRNTSIRSIAFSSCAAVALAAAADAAHAQDEAPEQV